MMNFQRNLLDIQEETLSMTLPSGLLKVRIIMYLLLVYERDFLFIVTTGNGEGIGSF